MADDLRRSGAGRSLRDLNVTGERTDNVAGEMGAVGRCDRRALVALEIIVNDELVAVMREHEIEARALEVAMKDQIGIFDHHRALRHVAMRLGGKGIDMVGGGRAEALAIQ
nr:hypothetical protein [Bradyrhizobium manausense]